jgi:hypothetical protein
MVMAPLLLPYRASRKAVELSPNNVRPHLALELALARGGQKEEARSELEKAVELAKADVRFVIRRFGRVRHLKERDFENV